MTTDRRETKDRLALLTIVCVGKYRKCRHCCVLNLEFSRSLISILQNGPDASLYDTSGKHILADDTACPWEQVVCYPLINEIRFSVGITLVS
jgi:hypothetical protein